MLKKALFTLFLSSGLWALPAPPCYAQTTAHWTIAPAVSANRWLDQQGSPLIYAANAYGLAGGYMRTSLHWQWQAHALAQAGSLHPVAHPQRYWYYIPNQTSGGTHLDSVPLGGTLIHTRLDLRAMRRWLLQERWQIAAGAGLSSWISYPTGMVRAGHLWANSLALEASTAWQPAPNWQFGGSFALPLAGWATRLPYHTTLAAPGESNLGMFWRQGTRFVLPNGYLAPEIGLSATRKLSQRLSVGLDYRFRRTYVAAPLPLTAIQSMFNINLNFHHL